MRELASRALLGSTVGALVGGRWAISWVAYLLNAPLNLVAIGSNASTSVEGAPWSAWLLVSVIGYLLFGAVLLATHLTVFRERARRPVPLIAVALLGAIAGGVRGLAVALLAQEWSLAPHDVMVVITRVVTGAVLGAVLIPLAAFILASIAAYRTQRAELLREQRRRGAVTMRDEGVTRAIEAALLVSVRADLDEVARTRNPELAREVSRRIWSQGEADVVEPSVRWTSVLRASVQRNPFATWPVALIWALSSIGTLTVTIGLGRAVGQIAFSIAMIALCFDLGRRVVRRRPAHSIAIFAVTVVFLVLLTGPIASALFDPRPWPAGLGLVMVNSLWLPLLAVASGFVVAVIQSSEEVLADLRDHVSDSAIAALAAHDERERVRRELATRLHGTVQSRLLAASMAVRDGELASAMLDDLAQVLDAPGDDGSLRDRLDAVSEPWTALMDVQLNCANDPPPFFADAVVRIVEEGLANAYRHGHARSVSISIDAKPDACTVVIRDDGDGRADDARPGMGSAVLSSIATGGWSLESHADGSVLTARISCGA